MNSEPKHLFDGYKFPWGRGEPLNDFDRRDMEAAEAIEHKVQKI